MDPRFSSEILDNLHQPPRVNLSRDCYYTGTLRFRSQSSVALSGCDGLVRADNVSLFIPRRRSCRQTVLDSCSCRSRQNIHNNSPLLSTRVQVLKDEACFLLSRDEVQTVKILPWKVIFAMLVVFCLLFFLSQMGLIQTSEEDYFIEPMAKRKKQPHLFYKRSSVLASLPQSSTFPRKCTLPPTHLQGYMSELLFLFILYLICCCSYRSKIIA